VQPERGHELTGAHYTGKPDSCAGFLHVTARASVNTEPAREKSGDALGQTHRMVYTRATAQLAEGLLQ
jgi:hypothetical protein